MKKCIATDKAPAAIGPYSAGIAAGQWVFTSGQIPIDPATGEFVPGDIAAQTKRSLQNVAAVLEAAGTDMNHVVKTTVFLADMADFAEVNRAYAAFFEETPPARSCVQVAALPKGARLEIEAIAVV